MRLTAVVCARVTPALYARARLGYVNRRGESVTASIGTRPATIHDAFHRVMDPAHDRWYLTRETFDDTFEWDIKSITIFASSVVLFISSYFMVRHLLNKAAVWERGVTLQQLESEHNSMWLFEPTGFDSTAYFDQVPLSHDFSPVYAGRYRMDHKF